MIDGLLFASCLHCALKKSLAVRFCLRLMGLPPCPSWANSVLRHMTTGTAFPRLTAHSLHQSTTVAGISFLSSRLYSLERLRVA
jgi:hypothetical protein